MLRFLLGIVLIQLATVALVFALLNAPLEGMQWVAIAILGLILSLLAAFWFAAISRGMQQDKLDGIREQHAQEREKLRVNAERQKTKIIKDSHQLMLKESKRAYSRANFKVGAAFAGAVAVGGLMLFTQFLTLGMLIMGTSGGALVGYLTRARQDRLRLQKANREVPRVVDERKVER